MEEGETSSEAGREKKINKGKSSPKEIRLGRKLCAPPLSLLSLKMKERKKEREKTFLGSCSGIKICARPTA